MHKFIHHKISHLQDYYLYISYFIFNEYLSNCFSNSEKIILKPVSLKIDDLPDTWHIKYILDIKYPTDWSKAITRTIPKIIILELPFQEYGIGAINENVINTVKEKYNPSIIEYFLPEIYSNTDYRRKLRHFRNSCVYLVDKKCREENAKGLIQKLKKILPGKQEFKEYEEIIKEIFDQFFDDCDAKGEVQKPVASKSFRIDILYYIEVFKDKFWERIVNETNTSHIIIECKNTEKSDELGKAISQVQKYFSSINTGSCAIITVRKKEKLFKMRHYAKLIESKNIFLLVLDDEDIINILSCENKSILQIASGNKITIEPFSSVGLLYKMMQDTRLLV